MKKLVCVLLSVSIMLTFLPMYTVAADGGFDGGDGSADNPYIISTIEQFKMAAGYSDSCFVQTSDIEIGGNYITSMTIGENAYYDGGGHKITGLKTSFASVNNGTIENLVIEDITLNVSAQACQVAPLAVTNNGTVKNCAVRNYSVSATSNVSGYWEAVAKAMAGGLVMYNGGVIENCYTVGSISAYASASTNGPSNTNATATAMAGGIAAQNYGTIKNSYSISGCSVRASKSAYTGRTEQYGGIICGYNGGNIENTYYMEHTDYQRGTAGIGGGSSDGVILSTAYEFRSYEMPTYKLGNYDYVWSMDSLNINSGYPILMTETDYGMILVPSVEPGNFIDDFDLELKSSEWDYGYQLYDIYYSIVGESTERTRFIKGDVIPINKDATTIIVYVEWRGSGNHKVYKLTYNRAKTAVTVNVLPGTYNDILSVALSAESGTEIYYTTDGSDPTLSGIRYTGSIDIFKNTTLLAAAKIDGVFGSVMKYDYKISPIITPSVEPGLYEEPFMLKLTSSLKPYEIYYADDGWSDPSDPESYSQVKKYTGEFEVYTSRIIRAAACFEGEWSEVYEFRYDFPQVTITPTVEQGEYQDIITLGLSCSNPALELQVLANGKRFTYTEPFAVYKSGTVYVYAYYNDNYITSESFGYTLPEPIITATPGEGAYSEIQEVAISCNIPSCDIYYTTDGSSPDTNGVLYTKEITVDKTTTIRTAAKYNDVLITESEFAFDLSTVPRVKSNYPSGDYYGPIYVALSSTNAFYDVLYTLDGSDPKTNGKLYDGAIEVLLPTVIRAVPCMGTKFGGEERLEYTFSYQNVSAHSYSVQKEKDYTLSFTVNNTYPISRAADFYIAVYDEEGNLRYVKKYDYEFEPNSVERVDLGFSVEPIVTEGEKIKLICWEDGTVKPLFAEKEILFRDILWSYQITDLTVNPGAITVKEGTRIENPKITAHYNNDYPDSDVLMNSTSMSSSDTSVVSCSYYDGLTAVGAGTATITFVYRGVSGTMEVTVEPDLEKGDFLADPAAAALPSSAIAISSASQLAAIGGADSEGKTYYLTQNIKLTGEWSPIYNFRGTLDGRGYKIMGLYVSDSSGCSGLFATTDGATLRNLAVSVSNDGVSANYASGRSYAGALIGQAWTTTIENCYSTGGIISAKGYEPVAGGLVGSLWYQDSNTHVTNCYSTCSISTESSTTYDVISGGLIGEFAAGIGANARSAISKSYATGVVYAGRRTSSSTGSKHVYAGGIVGEATGLKLTDCFASGNTTASLIYGGSGVTFAGGLVGYSIDAEISNCLVAYGTVKAYNNTSGYAGNIISRVYSGVDVSNCYAYGVSVTGKNIDTAGTTVAAGSEIDEESYPGFDFVNTWVIDDSFNYLPHLKRAE